MRKATYVSLLCSTMLALDAGAAMAQTGSTEVAAAPASEGLEDIVVTARRRAESLQEVPVTVSAISAAQLTNNLATDLTKVAELAPQVFIGRQTIGTGAVIGIRGISSTSSDPGLDQSVAVAIDNVVLSRGRIVQTGMFDIAQVEVLQGPQALFFGKNSPAGVISITSNNPTDQLEGYVRAGYEFKAEEIYAEGAISGPITDTLGIRVAGRIGVMKGWVRNVAEPVPYPLNPAITVPGANNGPKQPDGQDFAGRLTLVWEPSDSFDATVKILGSHQNLNAMNAYVESFCANGQTVPTALGRPIPYADCKKDMVKAEGGLPPEFAVNYPYGNGGVPNFNAEGLLASLTMNKQLEEVTVTSTTGYYHSNHHGTNNADYTSFSLLWSSQAEDYDLITQEIRLNSDFSGPLNFAAGGYYETSRRWFSNNPTILPGGLNVTGNNYTTVMTEAYSTSETWSFFAQLRLRLASTLELAAGARYSNDTKTQEAVNTANGVTTLPLRAEGSVLNSRYNGDNVSPEVTLTWKPTSDHMVYGAYKTGYKAGAISNGALLLTSATSTNLVVGNEEAEGFEVGYKGDLFDNRVRFNVTVYRYNYSGLQLGTFNPATISFTIQNAAEARTEGVTASLNWLATEGLTFNGNLGYNKARFQEFKDAQCYPGQTPALGCVGGRQDLTGAHLNRAPDLNFSLGANYQTSVIKGWLTELSADGSYSSWYPTSGDNAPGGVQDGFWRLNAAIHFGPDSGKYRFSLIGRNLTNSYYLVSSAGRPVGTVNEFAGIFNRPREVALQAELRF